MIDSRAFRTAQTIVDANVSIGNKDVIIKDGLLRERHFGRWENQPAKGFMEAARAAGFVTPTQMWLEFDDDTTETTADVTRRATKFIQVRTFAEDTRFLGPRRPLRLLELQ